MVCELYLAGGKAGSRHAAAAPQLAPRQLEAGEQEDPQAQD
jgi:hypothetical protein